MSWLSIPFLMINLFTTKPIKVESWKITQRDFVLSHLILHDLKGPWKVKSAWTERNRENLRQPLGQKMAYATCSWIHSECEMRSSSHTTWHVEYKIGIPERSRGTDFYVPFLSKGWKWPEFRIQNNYCHLICILSFLSPNEYWAIQYGQVILFKGSNYVWKLTSWVILFYCLLLRKTHLLISWTTPYRFRG